MFGQRRDFFRFKGRKDMRVVVDAVCSRIGSGVDPMIRLTKSDGRFIASADDTPGLLTDGYLTAVLPEDGDYVLEFCDSRFAGTGRAVYRLLVGAVPFAGELYPMALPRGQLAAIELRGGTLSGDRLFALRTPADPLLAMYCPRIPARLLGDPAWADSDLDVELLAPVPLTSGIAVLEPTEPRKSSRRCHRPWPSWGGSRSPASGTSSRSRPRRGASTRSGSRPGASVPRWMVSCAVLDKGGRLLGESDDGKGRPRRRAGGGGTRRRARCRRTRRTISTMPAGQDEVRIVVKDLMDRGGVGFPYRLIVEPAEAAFQLTLDDDQVAIPRGGTALIRVNIARGGYAGPIDLDIRGLAEGGVTAIPGVIPAGQALGLVGLKADPRQPIRHARHPGRGQGIRRPGRRGGADDRLRPADELVARLRHDRDDPRLLAAVRQPHRRGDPAGPIALDAGERSWWCPRGARSRCRSRSCGMAPRGRSTRSSPSCRRPA